MSIKIEHRNLEIRKTLNDFVVQVRNFLLPLSLKVFRHKEREAQSFYFGFFICLPPPRAMPATRPRKLAEANCLLPRQVSTLLSLQIPKILRVLPVRHVIRTCLPRYPSRAIVTSLNDTSAPPACAWTPVLMLHLSNPCA